MLSYVTLRPERSSPLTFSFSFWAAQSISASLEAKDEIGSGRCSRALHDPGSTLAASRGGLHYLLLRRLRMLLRQPRGCLLRLLLALLLLLLRPCSGP